MKARLLMTFRHAAELCAAQKELRLVLADLARYWPGNWLAISCVHRTREEEEDLRRRLHVKTSGIHVIGPPWRAADVAVGGWLERGVRDACDKVNRLWIYDPDRPELQVAVYTPHGTGPHVHVQVHPRTRRRDEA